MQRELTADDRETLVVHIDKANTWLDLGLLWVSRHPMMMIVSAVIPWASYPTKTAIDQISQFWTNCTILATMHNLRKRVFIDQSNIEITEIGGNKKFMSYSKFVVFLSLKTVKASREGTSPFGWPPSNLGPIWNSFFICTSLSTIFLPESFVKLLCGNSNWRNHVKYYLNFLKFCCSKRFDKFYILSSCVTSRTLALRPNDNLSILAQAGQADKVNRK